MSRLHDQLCSSATYRLRRKLFMLDHPGCQRCEAEGITMPSEELDHIVPLHEAPELALVESNWQALCRECHKQKTISENTQIAKPVGFDGWPIEQGGNDDD